MKKQFVIVGMSGGVDSSIVALLLKKHYYVEAIYMNNWHEESDNHNCSSSQDIKDALMVCELLKIKLQIVDFSIEYWKFVFQKCLNDFISGETPNPDILCNKEIKFHIFLDYAKSIGADLIATGHYAQKVMKNNIFSLMKGLDLNKDQSYFLHLLNQKQLSNSIFPLGAMKKEIVRKIAKDNSFPNFAKKDSTGICFIGERKFSDFLSEYLLNRPGNIVDTDNKILGKHNGIMFYTIGQRYGLGIGGKNFAKELPWYVIQKDIKNNVIVVSQDKTIYPLMAKKLICADIHWISNKLPKFPYLCKAKIRYRHEDQDCIINYHSKETYLVDFLKPQWAITPGQSIVFYCKNECLGGAKILKVD